MERLKRKLKARGIEAVFLIGFAILALTVQNQLNEEQQYRKTVQEQAADLSWKERELSVYQNGNVSGAEKTKLGLYATSAVLIDADSGRVLYGKNENEVRPMASTTKIMTCIIALEQADLSDQVTVSGYAAARPKVKLFMKRGENYQLKDLLYSIMLESHNDSAAAIAEYIGSRKLGEKVTGQTSEEDSRRYLNAFAGLMNQKAEEIGCENTWFITPNGLDATEEIEVKKPDGSVGVEEKVHSTTAKELALILRYCIRESSKKDLFLEITGTKTYSFSSLSENPRSFSCTNHNAFLSMMDGAFTGKTGFTNNAGYCYVGALKRDERTYIVALLGCGWPNHKSYKWSDTRVLMEYGLEQYQKKTWELSERTPGILVGDGVAECGNLSCPCVLGTYVDWGDGTFTCLLSDEDTLCSKLELCPQNTVGRFLYWNAPIAKTQQIGTLDLVLNGETVQSYPVCVSKSAGKVTLPLCWQKIVRMFFILP
ncbi:MAG: D-alanyl-D-alanine carboxypeptidase [Clostridiales bacterium]|nr:D-alanyl-D-alanine carboxypeptidase [Clostridiales bacterium]